MANWQNWDILVNGEWWDTVDENIASSIVGKCDRCDITAIMGTIGEYNRTIAIYCDDDKKRFLDTYILNY